MYSFQTEFLFLEFNFFIYFRPIKHVWHGSTVDGRTTNSSMNCQNWRISEITENFNSYYGTASDIVRNRLLGQARFDCRKKLILLCYFKEPISDL